jgi:hypothetical protein
LGVPFLGVADKRARMGHLGSSRMLVEDKQASRDKTNTLCSYCVIVVVVVVLCGCGCVLC